MNYYNEIEHYVKKNEINKKYHEISINNEDLENKWHIGRLIVEAQGGLTRAKYGNELIMKWSVKVTEKFGKGYNFTNLSRFRQYYITFPIVATLSQQLTWSHIQILLPIKEENKRNYYINQIIDNNWSIRMLRNAIKTGEYERLVHKPEKIEIKTQKELLCINSEFKDPIIINVPPDKKINTEKELENVILAQIQYFLVSLEKALL